MASFQGLYTFHDYVSNTGLIYEDSP